MKKLLCVLLVLTALTGLSVAALAAKEPSVTVTGSGALTAGQTIDFTVTVSDSGPVYSCQVLPVFDQQVFSLVDHQWLIQPEYERLNPADGAWMGAWSTTRYINGPVLRFTLRVKEQAATAQVSVQLAVTDQTEDPQVYTNITPVTLGSDCAHERYVERAEEQYLKTPGDCEHGAVYYVSCQVCGAAGTDTFQAEPIGHDFTAQVEQERYLADPGDCQHYQYYYYSCVHCGQAGTQTFVSNRLGEHQYDDGCDTDCNICGKYREATHEPKEEWSTDSSGHWHECANCGAEVDRQPHDPAEEPGEDGYIHCTVCGLVIGEEGTHTHRYADEWSYDEKGHWHACQECGRPDSVLSHTFEQVLSDRTDVVIQRCTECGYTQEDPVTEPTEPTEPTQSPTTEPTQPTGQQEEPSGTNVAAIVLGILLGLSLAANGVLGYLLYDTKRTKRPPRRDRP